MSSSSDLLSHPDRLLVDHLRDVGTNARNAVAQTSFGSELFDAGVFTAIAYITGICHDFGKATTWFQDYIRNPEKGHKDTRAYHAFVSSLFTYYVALKVLEKEFPQISPSDRDRLSYIAYYVVYYHHGDLANLDENYSIAFTDSSRLQKIEEQARDLLVISGKLQGIYDDLLFQKQSPVVVNIHDFLEGISSDRGMRAFVDRLKTTEISFKLLKDTNYYLKFIFLYSTLLSSDKGNASGIDPRVMDDERKRWSQSLNENLIQGHKKTLPHRNPAIDELRNKAYEDVIDAVRSIDIQKNRFFTIELPTGIGKTLTAFATSFILRERVRKEFGFTPRIIYSLPFLSIVDQNADVAGKVLQPLAGAEGIPPDLLMEHHHLSDIYYRFRGSGESDMESYDSEDIGKRYLLMEGWNSEVIVTTFVQLFHSLITNRNASVLKFHHITNSIIILDEVQALPPRYFKLLREVLAYLAENLNVWIILMTATLPIILPPDKVVPLVKDSNFYFSRMNRVSYSFDDSVLSLPDVCDKVMEIRKGDVMVIVNTVRASQDLYMLLKEEFVSMYGTPNISKGYAEFPDTILINMSTRITPNDRKDRIKAIEGDGGKRKIIVTTQLVEAGVDIDVDIIFRDIAPLDSIVQAGGRANRHGTRGTGAVNVLTMVNENGKPFSRMIYDPVMLDVTTKSLSELLPNPANRIGENEMHQLIGEYYRKLEPALSTKDSERHLGYIRNLDFSKIGKEFRLIEDEDKADMFVAKDRDEEALKVWEHYLEIKAMINPLERWKEMLRIRNCLYRYVVSVRRSVVGGIDEPLTLVGKNGISLKYDLEIGITGGLDSIW